MTIVRDLHKLKQELRDLKEVIEEIELPDKQMAVRQEGYCKKCGCQFEEALWTGIKGHED